MLKIIASCLLIGIVLGAVCPPAKIIHPCTCQEDNRTIVCQSKQIDYNLTEIFSLASNATKGSDKLFGGVHIQSSNMRHIDAHVFGDFKFGVIFLTDLNLLESVHPDAFAGNENVTTNFYIEGSGRPVTGMFESMSKFKAVKYHSFLGQAMTTLPKHGFYPLNTLIIIDLSWNYITRIEKEMLAFSDPSEHGLLIWLHNNLLNSTSVEVGFFDLVKRPLKLDLKNNYISYLDEKVYAPFLAQNPNNSLDVRNNPLECMNENNQWFLKDKHKYENQLSYSKCNIGY